MAARKSPPDVYANVGKQIKEGRHVGLDFYDLLIEALIVSRARRLSRIGRGARRHPLTSGGRV